MSHVVTLPALGESVTEGTVTRWLKAVGDAVAVDEPLLEISTDKVDTEIPSPVAGVLLEISAGEDATVEVGSALAVIGEQGAAVPDAPEPVDPPPVSAPPARPAPARPAPAPGPAMPVRSQVVAVDSPAPVARVPATQGWSAAHSEVERGKTTALASAGPARMVASLRTSAQLTTVVEVDLTAVHRLVTKAEADFGGREGVSLDVVAFVAKAAVEALKAHPKLNASVDSERDEVTHHDQEHLAVVVDTERGPLSPVVRNAGDLSVSGLAKRIGDLAGRARSDAIGPEEQSGATFTVTDLGSRGALFETPIILQPQVAVLGIGAVVKRAAVIDDPHLGETIAVRKLVFLALSYDHRLVDGADAGRFLTEVKGRLEAAQFDV